MSESETKGRCRREFESYYADKQVIPSESDWILADGIDRLAAELDDVKEMVREIALQAPSEVGRDASDVAVRAAKIERDAARADVERLKAELAARPAANCQEILDGSKPAAGWLTDDERELLSFLRGFYSGDDRILMGNWTRSRVSSVAKAILDRAGSPPVVEVPVMVFGSGSYEMQKRYRDAMDKAGVPWKEAPRE